MIEFTIVSAYAGTIVGDYSNRIQGAKIAQGSRGYAECTGFLPLSLSDSFLLYDRPGLPCVRFSDSGSGTIYEGRLEDVNIVDGGVNITALGYAHALTDVPYTALWSTTNPSMFYPLSFAELTSRTPDKYNIDLNGRIYISTKKGLTYTNNLDIGAVILKVPYGGRKIVGFSFDYTINLPNPGPSSWSFGYDGWNEGYSLTGNATITATSGTAFNRTVHYVITASDFLELYIVNSSGGANTPAGDDGTNFVEIRNLRVVTSTANRVNTTLGTTFGAGGVQVVTPPSMANIYVGQSLQIRQGTNTSESVTVSAVTATTFTATYAGPHTNTDAVNAHVVYADDIVEDVAAVAVAVNPAQLSASVALIQSPLRDLTDQLFIDANCADILDQLVLLGDNQTTPRQWEWGVRDGQILYYRPQSTTIRTWYVDVSSIDIQRTIDTLANAVYATYQDARNRRITGTMQTSAISSARYGLTRRAAIAEQTTNATQATAHAAAYLADNKDPKPRSGIAIDRVFDANGVRWPLAQVDSGDTIVIRNLPPTLSSAIDHIRVFRISRLDYAIDTDTLTIEPELPLPSLSALLALALAPGRRGAPQTIFT